MSDEQSVSAPIGTVPHKVEEPLGRRRRFDDSYGLVLLLLVVSYFCDAALGDYTWGRVVIVFVLAASTWLALRASQVERRPMRIAQAVIPLLCVAAAASLLIGPGRRQAARTERLSDSPRSARSYSTGLWSATVRPVAGAFARRARLRLLNDRRSSS